jgi:L-asparaginase II
MSKTQFVPLVEVTRGSIVESIHFGAFAICDASGKLQFSAGDPMAFTYLRSSAKPFQVLPLLEHGGMDYFGFTERELAVMCASHHGTDEHILVINSLQQKIGISFRDLQCGMHAPSDPRTADRMFRNRETNSPLRHNCSGKHSSMLAQARLGGFPLESYLDPSHPVQVAILRTFSELTGVPVEKIPLGTDGCSAPVFAVPLQSAAWAFAQLADLSHLPDPRQASLRLIFKAMTSNPDMVAGPDAFDTLLMTIGRGKILSKGGAEGYQAVALLPDACGKGSPAFGVTIKVSDGDLASRDWQTQASEIIRDGGGRARSSITVELLRQLGALDEKQLDDLHAFTARPQFNWRHIEVGQIRPAFTLKKD